MSARTDVRAVELDKQQRETILQGLHLHTVELRIVRRSHARKMAMLVNPPKRAQEHLLEIERWLNAVDDAIKAVAAVHA